MDHPGFKRIIGFIVGGLTILISHVILSKRYKWPLKYMGPIQHFITMLISLEFAIAGNPSISDVDGFTVTVAITSSLSILSHD
jgi:hypothetical protein